jgi:hypothetical protein
MTGTGQGGRISRQDVLSRASALRPPPIKLRAARAAGGRFGHPSPAQVSPGRTPEALVKAAAVAPQPTLFGAGYLPPFTASGIPPEALLEVPWRARHSMAAAETPQDAYAILHAFTGLSAADAEDLAAVEYGSHPGNADYAHRVEQWLADGVSDEELYGLFYGD